MSYLKLGYYHFLPHLFLAHNSTSNNLSHKITDSFLTSGYVCGIVCGSNHRLWQLVAVMSKKNAYNNR